MTYSFSDLKMHALFFDSTERTTVDLALRVELMRTILTLADVRRSLSRGPLSPDYEAYLSAQRGTYERASSELARRLAS